MCRFIDIISVQSSRCQLIAPDQAYANAGEATEAHTWYQYTYVLCESGERHRKACDSAVPIEGSISADNSAASTRNDVCRVCMELQHAEQARQQAEVEILADYNRAIAEASAKFTRDTEVADAEKTRAVQGAYTVNRLVG